MQCSSGEYTPKHAPDDILDPQTSPSCGSIKDDQNMVTVINNVLKKIIPSEKEESYLKSVTNKVLKEVNEILKKISAEQFLIEIHGSFVKDTWLAGNRDIDIFIFFKKKLDKEKLAGIIKRLSTELRYKHEFRFAEHPYLHIYVNDIEFDIVPGFFSEKIVSPIDRSPYHTKFINEMLTDDQKKHVRLLKAFLKGIDCYGAEIKVGGFSGYLCELLILAFGTFENALRQLTRRKRLFIDFTKSWSKKTAYARFNSPIIVIDPVDRNRNAAAAVRLETLNKIRFFAILFLRNPSIIFFFPSKNEPTDQILLNEIKKRNIILVALLKTSVVEDIYWGQGLRTAEKLRKHLAKQGFRIINIKTWDSRDYFIIGLETIEKQLEIHKVLGPPLIATAEHIIKFTEKHKRIWIDKSRLFTIKIMTIEPKDIVKDILGKLRLKPSFQHYKILTEPEEIIKFIKETQTTYEFAEFLFGYIARISPEFFQKEAAVR